MASKKANACDEICNIIGFKRIKTGVKEFSYEELYALKCYLSITKDMAQRIRIELETQKYVKQQIKNYKKLPKSRR